MNMKNLFWGEGYNKDERVRRAMDKAGHNALHFFILGSVATILLLGFLNWEGFYREMLVLGIAVVTTGFFYFFQVVCQGLGEEADLVTLSRRSTKQQFLRIFLLAVGIGTGGTIWLGFVDGWSQPVTVWLLAWGLYTAIAFIFSTISHFGIKALGFWFQKRIQKKWAAAESQEADSHNLPEE